MRDLYAGPAEESIERAPCSEGMHRLLRIGLIGLACSAGMTASGPPLVNAGSTETITVNWANLLSDTIYLGGISHNTPQGLVGLTLVTIGN